jgi:hypothetical protein
MANIALPTKSSLAQGCRVTYLFNPLVFPKASDRQNAAKVPWTGEVPPGERVFPPPNLQLQWMYVYTYIGASPLEIRRRKLLHL